MPDLLRQKQEEDNDIKSVIQWLKNNSKPDWNTVRAQSPALKTYWHQLDSLKIIDVILYRQLEPLNESVIIVKQLLLPRSLKFEFLDSVNTGLAGHMRMTKTSEECLTSFETNGNYRREGRRKEMNNT